MKLGYLGESEYRTVLEHSKEVSLGITEEVQGVVMERANIEPPPDLPALNTCTGVCALERSESLREEFLHAHSVEIAYPQTYLYGYMGVDGLSPVIELTYSVRFLTGEVGPQVGFVQGAGLLSKINPLDALPEAKDVLDSLRDIGYRGEIALGVSPHFRICEIMFGHFVGGFALFAELCASSVDEVFEWCLRGGKQPVVHDNVSLVTLLSYPPFPYLGDASISVKAPTGAEKHLYRVLQGNVETAYAAAWGKDVYEGKRRVRKTIENCKAYNKDIQYRIDYGCKQRFLLNGDRWEELGGN